MNRPKGITVNIVLEPFLNVTDNVKNCNINMISLFALIIVLGIVVDDAVVVGESIISEQENGKKGMQAAMDGVKAVIEERARVHGSLKERIKSILSVKRTQDVSRRCVERRPEGESALRST